MTGKIGEYCRHWAFDDMVMTGVLSSTEAHSWITPIRQFRAHAAERHAIGILLVEIGVTIE